MPIDIIPSSIDPGQLITPLPMGELEVVTVETAPEEFPHLDQMTSYYSSMNPVELLKEHTIFRLSQCTPELVEEISKRLPQPSMKVNMAVTNMYSMDHFIKQINSDFLTIFFDPVEAIDRNTAPDIQQLAFSKVIDSQYVKVKRIFFCETEEFPPQYLLERILSGCTPLSAPLFLETLKAMPVLSNVLVDGH